MKARKPFEDGFKRLYFHVKPVGQNDLTNWSNYLDYELIHGNVVCGVFCCALSCFVLICCTAMRCFDDDLMMT